MFLIGIIANSKNFQTLKNHLCTEKEKDSYQIVHICRKSIENIKNIKFDIIIMTCAITNMIDKSDLIKKICVNSKYLILNADIDIQLQFLKKEKIIVITYGLNQKSTVTISSINEEDALIAIQRSFQNKQGKKIEMGEKNILLKENNKLSLQDVLVIFIVSLILEEHNLELPRKM